MAPAHVAADEDHTSAELSASTVDTQLSVRSGDSGAYPRLPSWHIEFATQIGPVSLDTVAIVHFVQDRGGCDVRTAGQRQETACSQQRNHESHVANIAVDEKTCGLPARQCVTGSLWHQDSLSGCRMLLAADRFQNPIGRLCRNCLAAASLDGNAAYCSPFGRGSRALSAINLCNSSVSSSCTRPGSSSARFWVSPRSLLRS